MKKKILALIALTLTMATTSVTALAAPSVISGDVVVAAAEQVLTFGENGTVGAENVTVGLIDSEDVSMTTISNEVAAVVSDKVEEVQTAAAADGRAVANAVAFDLSSDQTEATVDVLYSLATETDKAYGQIKVLHQLHDGTWEELEYESFNGRLRLYFKNGFSPVVIVKYDTPVSGVEYASQTSTVSGNTSPKTGEAYPYVAVIAMAAIACGFVCTKKITNR